MSTLAKRVQRLEGAVDAKASTLYVVEMPVEQADDDRARERALATLGVARQASNLVVIVRRFGGPVGSRVL